MKKYVKLYEHKDNELIKQNYEYIINAYLLLYDIKLPILKSTNRFKTAIILGGGQSINTHKEAIIKFADYYSDCYQK